ncbi:MAG: pitrilysin family protein [Myxococcota bacterium]
MVAQRKNESEHSELSYGPVRRVLQNGLTVVLEESHQAKVVAFQVWIKVGSADESEDEAGIAHVHEHMLFKGTSKRGVGEIAQAVEAAGGDINAWTSFDQTVYHVVMASRFFDQGLDVLADAVRNSSFDPTELDKELEVVIEEVKRSRDMPGRVVSELTFDTAYQAHPYRRPVIGFESTVRAFTRDKIVNFYRKHYRPDRMVVVVVGDFKTEEALAKVEKAFGDMGPPAGAPVQRAAEPEQKELRVRVVQDKIQETHLSLAWHIPSMLSEDIYALDVLSILLGHGDSSRLSRGVKHGRRLVNDVYAYAYTPKDPGLLMAGASLHHKDLLTSLQAILVETFRLRDSLTTAAELEKAKTLIESDSVYQKETVQGLARKLGFYEAVAGHVDFERRYLESIRKVTAHDIRRVAQKYLVESGLTVVALLPDSAPAVTEADIRKAVQGATDELGKMRQRSPLARGDLGVHRAVLSNGMTLLVQPDPSVPVVSMRAVWLGGLRHETPENNGIHNMMAELLTKGIEGGMGAMELAHEVDSAAGTLEGFTGRNSFGVRAEFLTRTFEHGFELMSDCIIRPAFSVEELERERKLILEEIRNKEDNLSGVAFDLFGKLLYRNHPYRMDTLGTRETVEKFTREDLLRFYRQNFTPDRMVLSVVGDVDPERVAELCEDAFNDAPRAPAGVTPLQVQPEGAVGETRIARLEREKEQAHLVLGFPGTTLAHQDRYALEVLTTILAGQGGRLFLELRDKQSLAYSITAFSLEGVDPGYVAVYMGTSPDKVDTAMKGIMGELRRIQDEPVSAKELERAQRYLVGTHEIGLQKMSARAATLAFNEVYGLGYAEHARYSERILAVTAEDLRRVARQYLTLDRYTLAIVGPEGTQGPQATAKP